MDSLPPGTVCSSVTSAVGKPRQEDSHECEANLSYIVSNQPNPRCCPRQQDAIDDDNDDDGLEDGSIKNVLATQA